MAEETDSQTPTDSSALRSHPEQRPEELYLGNTRPEDVWRSSWRTSRLGENPLKADGTPYTYGDLKPWFIQRAEVHAEIEKEKRNSQPWSPERIRVFEEMLADGNTQNTN